MKRCINQRVMLTTCCLMMLPLNSNRRQVETFVSEFGQYAKTYNRNQHYDLTVQRNIQRLYLDSPSAGLPNQRKFLAQYLTTFPFLKRLSEKFLYEKLDKFTIQTLSY